jgi:hypothetical protein
MRAVDSLVVLPEELATLLLRQVAENYLGVIWILDLNRLSGHAPNQQQGTDTGLWQRGRRWLTIAHVTHSFLRSP